MKRKELTKTVMMISIEKNHCSHALYTSIPALSDVLTTLIETRRWANPFNSRHAAYVNVKNIVEVF